MFDGFTPSLAGVVCSATVVVVVDADVVVSAGGGASCFTCPGALAELPGAASVAPAFPLPFPLAFPFPLPAYAGTANAKTPRTSTHVPFSRMVILPLTLPRLSR